MTYEKRRTEKLRRIIRRVDRAVLDFLFPPRCPFCDRVVLPEEGVCPACRKKLRPVKEPVCMKCGKPLSDQRKEYCADCVKQSRSFAQGKALWIYKEEVKTSIYRFKYQNKREYGKTYAAEMAKRYGGWIRSKKIQAIVPVPLHKNRRKQRGYNQAEVLAKELGEILNLPVRADLLERVRDTSPQKTLNNRERKNNLKKAFKTTENIVQLKYILAVDDIYTTGSTLHAVAEALLEAGAKEVYACCVGIGSED